MKILFTFIFLFSFGSLSAQTGWNKQSIPTTQYLPKIFFLNKDTGWTGGIEGLYWTTNGGDQWLLLTTKYVADPTFVDGKNGWGITSRTSVGKTIDGGKTWVDYTIPQMQGGSGIHQLQIFSMDTIYVNASDEFARSTDGGASWKNQDVAPVDGDFHFIDNKIGFMCGKAYMWFNDPPPAPGSVGAAFEYTTDGGQSWHAKFPFIAGTDSQSFVIENFDNVVATKQNIYVAADTSIYKSTNNGESWQQILRQVATNEIFFLSDSTGYAVGGGGSIRFTKDGGRTWSQQNSTVTTSLRGIVFIDTLHGWACGDLGTIVHTSDGGKSWIRQYLPQPLTTSVNPEPFGRRTSISYELPKASKVRIRIYDALGRELEVLDSDSILESGTHRVEFDGSKYPEGTFYYRIETDSFIGTGKMTKVVY